MSPAITTALRWDDSARAAWACTVAWRHHTGQNKQQGRIRRPKREQPGTRVAFPLHWGRKNCAQGLSNTANAGKRRHRGSSYDYGLLTLYEQLQSADWKHSCQTEDRIQRVLLRTFAVEVMPQADKKLRWRIPAAARQSAEQVGCLGGRGQREQNYISPV